MTTQHTHTSTGRTFRDQTCIACFSPLIIGYVATNNETGADEVFGPNCHFGATGVDTRLATARFEAAARSERNRANMPADEVTLLDAALDATAHLDTADLEPRDVAVLYDLRQWSDRWTRGQAHLDEWLNRVANNLVDGPLVEAIRSVVVQTIDGKKMTSRFAGTCGTCEADIAKGADIVYNGRAHCASHAA